MSFNWLKSGDGSPSRKAAWALLVGILFLPIAVIYMGGVAFSRPIGQDDEGYLMVTVQGFLQGHVLYDSIFTQYGPLYYQYQWLVHTLLNLPVTHDLTRLFCVLHWLLAAIVLGIAGGVMARSALAGLFLGLQAIIHLQPIANEPGHPQELVAVLLALAVLAAASIKNWQTACQVIAVIAAALACLKINVGFFVGIAVFLAVRSAASDRFARGLWPWLLVAGSACLPFVLMRRHLGAEWGRHYAIMSCITVLSAGLVALRFAVKEPQKLGQYLRVGAAFFVPLIAIFGITLLQGTTSHGLVEALITIPFNLPNIGFLSVPLPVSVLVNASISLVIAVIFVAQSEEGYIAKQLPFLKLLFGAYVTLRIVDNIYAQFAYLMPWLWLVLAPEGQGEDRRVPFSRILLALLAAWQGLQAYPIAGTQMALATFLLTAIGTVCLADGIRAQLKKHTQTESGQGTVVPMWRYAQIAPFLVFVALWAVFVYWCQPWQWRQYYASLTSLDLPGAHYVRLDGETAQTSQEVTRYLADNADSFVMYPGFNSYYFWTGQKPPTQFNCTGWGLLSWNQQEQILAALQKGQRPLIAVHELRLADWRQGAPTPIRPLVEFVLGQCQEAGRIKPFVFFRPNNAASAPNPKPPPQI